MNRHFKVLVAAAASLSLWTAALQAAVLYGFGDQDMVMVDTGSGFRRATGTMELKPGDIVKVVSGGGVHISYADGCDQDIKVGTATVAEQSPCTLNADNNVQHQEPNGAFGLSSQALVTGALVATVAGVAIAVGVSGNNSSKPASP